MPEILESIPVEAIKPELQSWENVLTYVNYEAFPSDLVQKMKKLLTEVRLALSHETIRASDYELMKEKFYDISEEMPEVVN